MEGLTLESDEDEMEDAIARCKVPTKAIGLQAHAARSPRIWRAWAAVAKDEPDLHHYVVGRTMGDAYEAELVGRARAVGAHERLHFGIRLARSTDDPIR